MDSEKSVLSKGVVKKVRIPIGTGIKLRSPGVTLSSEKVIKREKSFKYRTTICRKTEKIIYIATLNKGYVLRLEMIGSLKSNSFVSGNTLYTVGMSSTINGDDFVQFFEPKTLRDLNDVCINKTIPSTKILVCKVVTEDGNENSDIGSIMTTLTLRLTKTVSN
jgi:hypothetical protein